MEKQRAAFDKAKYDREMREACKEQEGYISDLMKEYHDVNVDVRDMNIYREIPEETIKKIQNMEIPRQGRDFKEVTKEMIEDVYDNAMLIQHPRFLSFVASAVSPYSRAGAMLSDIYNLNVAGYELASGACLIEERIIKWIAERAGYDTEKCGGIFLSGGSMSNMSACIAAREAKLKETEYPIGVTYVSDQTHSSLKKDLRMIGLRSDQIIIIPTDDNFRMRTDLLKESVEKEIKAGRKPYFVAGTVGTTNTGSIDPLQEIGEICAEYDMWFHVDGAYGGSILISDIYKNLAKGIELSDSFSWDSHKWALQTYSCSCLVAKNKTNLLNAFTEHPEYLADAISAEHSDPWDLGPEMSRPARALKLWFTLQVMGTDLLQDVIDYSFYNSIIARDKILEHENWEITSPPCCGALTFRYAPAGYTPEELDDLNAEISKRIISSGFAYIVTTIIKEKRVLRLCLINGNTTDEDVIQTIDKLDEIARECVREKRLS